MLPLFPRPPSHFQMLILLIALFSILYGSVMAFTQTEARLIAGYSSVAQLGFITLGIFALKPQGAQGALLQMVNHGLVVAPLFFIILLLSERAGGSEDIRDMGGMAFRAPVLATFFLIVTLATLAMPGSGNFIGEFLILLGVFKSKIVFSIIAFSGRRDGERLRAARLHPHDAQPRRPDGCARASCVSATASCSSRCSLVILFFALYPQLALQAQPALGHGGGGGGAAGGDGAARSRRRHVAGRRQLTVTCDADALAEWPNVPPSSASHDRLPPPIPTARTSTGRASRRSIALLGGALVVLMFGLLGDRGARERGVPLLTLIVASRRRSA